MSSVVVIGGGLGGLMTAAILSKEGWTVTVLEKNPVIGGGLQSFTRLGEVFDTGMHFVGGLQPGGSVRRICEYLGIVDRLHILDADPAWMDTVFVSEDRQSYRIAQGRDGLVESLGRYFPSERDNLAAYADAMYRVAGEEDLYQLRPGRDAEHSPEYDMPAGAFIEKYIRDPRLRRIVAYMNPLYAGRPDTTPAYVHAIISTLYMDGPSRFAGGSVRFAHTLRDYIMEHGGRVLAGDAVRTVRSEGRVITGLETVHGKAYQADAYVCAIHPCTFFGLLEDPSMLPKAYRERLEALPNAYSAFVVNIKFRKDSFPFQNRTTYWVAGYEDMWNQDQASSWPGGIVAVTPPDLDQGACAGKMILTAPMAWEAVKPWEHTVHGHRPAAYEAWKTSCAERLLDRMEEVFPGFRSAVEAVNTASPLTIRDFYGVKEGSLYGFSKDCHDLILSNVPVYTKVPNLFLTGQNCHLHGFCGVSLTAVETAERILGRNVIRL